VSYESRRKLRRKWRERAEESKEKRAIAIKVRKNISV
jgi:hypothetical protein